MDRSRHNDPGDFPRNGFRARRWLRFERDLEAWLATPEGRFARWCARRQLERGGLRPHAGVSGSVRRAT
jgi:hypothetical protein